MKRRIKPTTPKFRSRPTMQLAALGLALSCFGCFNALPASADNAAGFAGEMIFYMDMKSALQAAKRSNKYILADLYTDWCTFCKVLDKQAFQDPSMIRFFNSEFVCAKFNGEDNGAGTKLATEQKVSGYPTLLILNQEGRVLGRIEGIRKNDQLKEELTKIIEANPK